MQAKLIGIAVGLLLCSGVAAYGQHGLPNGNNAVSLQYVHTYDAEKESLQLDDVREVTEQIAIREVDPATGVVRIIPAEDTRQIIERRCYRLVDLRALSPKGEALKLAEVLPKLKANHPVIVVQRGKKLPPAYQNLLRDDVIVLELPADRRPGLPPTVVPAAPVGFSVPPDTRPRLAAPPALPFSPMPPTPADDRF